jgi:hypothetical protein
LAGTLIPERVGQSAWPGSSGDRGGAVIELRMTICPAERETPPSATDAYGKWERGRRSSVLIPAAAIEQHGYRTD